MKIFATRALLLLGCAAIVSHAALADDGRHPPGPPPGLHGAPPGPHGGPPGLHGGAPMLADGVELGEAQQDKVFAIMHAQQPILREQEKAQRKAHLALRAMADSGQFDEARAAALAQAAAKAMAAIELQRARSEAQVFALLTPEQRRQAAESRARGAPRPTPN